METYFLISYSNKDLKIISAEDKADKFEITYKPVSNPSEILGVSAGGSPGQRPSTGTDVLQNMKSAWRIDIKTSYKKIAEDMKEARRANYNFLVRTDDEGIESFDLSLYLALKSYITAYPETINIHINAEKTQPAVESGIRRKIFLNTSNNDKFRIKRVYSDLEELSFSYNGEDMLSRHSIDVLLPLQEKYSRQAGEITVELFYDKQTTVKVPLFLINVK